MPVSKLKVEIARILRDNHYIQDFKALDDGRHGLLRLYLKYHNDAPVIRELVRVSAPGLRRYVKAREIPRAISCPAVPTPTRLPARACHPSFALFRVYKNTLLQSSPSYNSYAASSFSQISS